MLDKYENKVKLVFKNFPLESHGFAFMAATAALAANQQKKFWEYHKKLFENFNSLDDRKLQALAAELGLDVDKFKLDMQSSGINNVINRDIGDGYMAEVSGIPAVFVNGKRLEDHTLQGFQQVIDFELNKKANISPDPDKASQ